MGNNNFEAKKAIVLAGNSKIYKNWSEHSNITKEDFIEALEWLCADPLNEYGLMTREIGLTPNGIVRLGRAYSKGLLCAFYLNGELWGGATFTRPCLTDTDRKWSEDGKTIKEHHQISLSCRDRV